MFLTRIPPRLGYYGAAIEIGAALVQAAECIVIVVFVRDWSLTAWQRSDPLGLGRCVIGCTWR